MIGIIFTLCNNTRTFSVLFELSIEKKKYDNKRDVYSVIYQAVSCFHIKRKLLNAR